jgi:GNAT superfamily N-acetyltransferase
MAAGARSGPEVRAPTGLSFVDLATVPNHRCLALSCEAGWNQTAADWSRMLALGRGFGLVEGDGALVATALVLPYDAGIAWISMVLVARRWRRRGLASLLMRRALAETEALDRTACLDATPEGAAVYRALGFADDAGFTRWHRPAAPTAQDDARSPMPARAAQPGASADWPAAVARDARALGAPRQALLEALAAEGSGVVSADGSLLLRPGRLAWQLGPLVAQGRDAAESLLAEGLGTLRGEPVFADARDGSGLEAALAAAGFAPQRSFLRMHRGGPPESRPELLWLTAGPEFG